MHPPFSFHLAEFDGGNGIKRFRSSQQSDIWINGGYFIFRSEIFEYMREGEELVLEPFNRLIEKNLLMAYKHEGFWRAMDTLRDRQVLEEMVERGDMPWRPSHDSWRRPTIRPRRSDVVRSLRLAGRGRSPLAPLPRRAFRRHRDRCRRLAAGPDGARRASSTSFWCVLSGAGKREEEARSSASDFLAQAASAKVEVKTFRDTFFPEQAEGIKAYLEELKTRVRSGRRSSRTGARMRTRITGRSAG